MTLLYEVKMKEGFVRKGAHHVRILFIEGEPILEFHTAIFGQRNLELKSAKEQLLEEFALLEEKKVKSFLLKKLSERNYCSQELKKTLRKFLVREGLICSLIEEFTRMGFINDEEFITSVIRGAKAKKCGTEWILQKLKGKGISEDEAKNSLELNDSFDERVLRIQSLLITKYKRRNLRDFKERQKVACSLVRKGYSFEEIKAAFQLSTSL